MFSDRNPSTFHWTFKVCANTCSPREEPTDLPRKREVSSEEAEKKGNQEISLTVRSTDVP